MTVSRFTRVTAAICGIAILVVSSANAEKKPKPKPKPMAKYTVGKKYLVLTIDGKVQSGTLTKENKESIWLTPNGAKQVEVPKKDIETIKEVSTGAFVAKPLQIAKPVPMVKKIVKVVPAAKPQVKTVQAVQQRQPLFQARGRTTFPVRDTVDPNDPTERMLVLTPQGPFIAEFAIYLDGKPFRAAAEQLIDELLKHADTNKDGKATWEEAFANPRFSLQPYRYVANNAATIKAYVNRYDLNRDGIVNRYELRSALADINRGSTFAVMPSYTTNQAPDLMPLLDTNKDGVLSADELAAASDRLKSRDADDNDLLDFTEVSAATGTAMPRGVRFPTQPRDVHLLGPTAGLTSIFSTLQSRYASGEKAIPTTVFRAAPELAEMLDLNKNGKIESGEMIGLHLAKPQLKIEIRTGSSDKQGIGVRVLQAAKGFEFSSKSQSARLTVSLPAWKMNVGAVQTVNTGMSIGERTANSYLSQFDSDNNGYLTEEELKKQGTSASFLLRYFATWDEDGDGKVFKKEIIAFYDRTQRPRTTRVLGDTSSSGPSLFAALDTSGDNRLSLREMRLAGERLKQLDRNKNGKLEADELQSETQLSFRQDGYAAQQRFVVANPYGGLIQAGVGPRKGPKWFIHMDKNGDGDVTLREFLGTKAQFEKLDTNKDGFIERSEAEAAAK